MQTEKNKWVDEVLESTRGMNGAETHISSDEIISAITGSSHGYRIKTYVDNSLVARIAASVTFLLLLNALTIYSYQNNMSKISRAQQMQAAASEFGLGQSADSDPGAVIFGN